MYIHVKKATVQKRGNLENRTPHTWRGGSSFNPLHTSGGLPSTLRAPWGSPRAPAWRASPGMKCMLQMHLWVFFWILCLQFLLGFATSCALYVVIITLCVSNAALWSQKINTTATALFFFVGCAHAFQHQQVTRNPRKHVCPICPQGHVLQGYGELLQADRKSWPGAPTNFTVCSGLDCLDCLDRDRLWLCQCNRHEWAGWLSWQKGSTSGGKLLHPEGLLQRWGVRLKAKGGGLWWGRSFGSVRGGFFPATGHHKTWLFINQVSTSLAPSYVVVPVFEGKEEPDQPFSPFNAFLLSVACCESLFGIKVFPKENFNPSDTKKKPRPQKHWLAEMAV